MKITINEVPLPSQLYDLCDVLNSIGSDFDIEKVDKVITGATNVYYVYLYERHNKNNQINYWSFNNHGDILNEQIHTDYYSETYCDTRLL